MRALVSLLGIVIVAFAFLMVGMTFFDRAGAHVAANGKTPETILAVIAGFFVLMIGAFLWGGLQRTEHSRKHGAAMWIIATGVLFVVALLAGQP